METVLLELGKIDDCCSRNPTHGSFRMISSEYIPQDRLIRFQKIKKTIELAYERVFQSLNEKSALPYVPDIYPVPFMITKTYTVHARVVKVLFYSIAYPDKNNFERFAMYPTLTLIERLPDSLIGVIGHEIAHIISLKGRVSITKSDLNLALRNRQQSARSKEEKAKAVYKYFGEPVLSEIIRWDRISMQNEIEQIVSKDVQLVGQQSFDKMIFKEKLEEYHDFIKSKLSDSEQRLTES